MNRFSRRAKKEQKVGIEARVGLGLGIAIGFFVLSSALASSNLSTLHDDTQKLIQSQQVITALDRLLSSMQDAETGQRGFLLTYNERYLEPYTTALSVLPERLAEIAKLTRDNPQQQASLIPLKLHVEGKLYELKQTIALRRGQGLDAALVQINTDRGKVEMDAVRAQVMSMSQEEIDVRGRRLAEMNAAYTTAMGSGVLSGVLGVGFRAVQRYAYPIMLINSSTPASAAL
jgi:CHASE3 domain sensor protein